MADQEELGMRVSAETKNATGKRILEVAQKLFAERGFEATTTRDIARAAHIATGTLFNYFPTKEAIVEALVFEACCRATAEFTAKSDVDRSLEEELFAHIALLLRKFKPLRKYFASVLETALSPLVTDQRSTSSTMRGAHLETVAGILQKHGQTEALSTLSLHLYWTLYVGVLAFWITDASPRQEDTLALLDESMAMFVAWLTGPAAQK
jgi:AcrR family transcriptional regulator